MRITGLILAGGKARRMGGVDKGLVPFLGKAMVTHVIERLAPQVDTILVNANRALENYQPFNLSLVPDEIGDFFGPLAGLHAGLKAAKTDLVLCVPCDSPLLPKDLAARLMQVLGASNADVAVVKTSEQTHPVFCLCKTTLVESLAQYLNSGGRKVDDWQKSQHFVEVDFSDQALAFSNINTAEELAALEAITSKISA